MPGRQRIQRRATTAGPHGAADAAGTDRDPHGFGEVPRHLVGHRASDGSLVYSNAVLIDSLM